MKENKANMKVLCKDANELAPIPSTDIPSSMEIEPIAPLSEPKFRVGDLIRNRILKSLQAKDKRIEYWRVDLITVDDLAIKYTVSNVLGGRCRKCFSEIELELGEEHGFVPSLTSEVASSSAMRQIIQSVKYVEKNKRVKVKERLHGAIKSNQESERERINLKRKITKVNNENVELKHKNKILADESNQVNAATIFVTPVQYLTPKAIQVVEAHNSIVGVSIARTVNKLAIAKSTIKTADSTINNLKGELKSTIKTANSTIKILKGELKSSRTKQINTNQQLSTLKRDCRDYRKEINSLTGHCEYLNDEEVERSDTDTATDAASAYYSEILEIIRIILAQTSCRKTAEIKGKDLHR